MESSAIKALDYFNSTRHIIIYYEDLIKDPTVRILFFLLLCTTIIAQNTTYKENLFSSDLVQEN